MRYFLLLLLFAAIGFSCRKNHDKPIVPVENVFEVMPVRFPQHVLLEYFSDEGQLATIDHAKQVSDLMLQYPTQLFPVNIHRNDFLATSFTPYIEIALGGLVNISRGAINRMPASGAGSEDGLILISPEHWESAILRARSSQEAPLSIALETGVNTADGDTAKPGYCRVHVAHKTPIEGDIRLVVYLLENNVQSKFQVGAPPGFTHQYVFKDILTAFEGNPIQLNEVSSNGSIHTYLFDQIDISQVNILNASIVAFIYKNDPDFRKRSVLNVQGVKFFGIKPWAVE
jgi:hypothetical protein